MIRLLKKQEPKALVIDAGDIFQGTPLYTKYHGEVEIALLNMIGYDIFTIGNHEFDDGPINLANQLKQAKFDVINCNMDCSAVPQLAALIHPHVIKEIDGQKVAFIGAITPDLNEVALKTGGVKIKATGKDWMQPIQEQIKSVSAQGINKIVLVTHVGIEKDKELAELPEVDAIISGHSHTRLEQPVVVPHPDGSSTTIVQTGCFSRALGKLELTFDHQGRVVVPKTEYRLINISDKIPQDNDLRAFVDEKLQPLLVLRQTFVGEAKQAFDNTFRNMPWDSPLGDIICDALVESGKDYGVTLAFENRGGIRGRIEPGPVSLEAVEQLLPFDNRPVFATVTGDCLMHALEHSLSGTLGGLFLDEHGLKIAYDPQAERNHRIVFALADDGQGGWKSIAAESLYKIAINDYSFGGGEGYNFKTATNVVKGEVRLSEVFNTYMRNHHVIAPQHPDRLIPVTKGLLASSGKTLQIRNAPAGARVIFAKGTGQGISTIGGDIPVPLANATVLGRSHCDSTGSCDIAAPTGGFAAAIVLPGKRAKQFSYPVEL
jgi:5'-nucleotidase